MHKAALSRIGEFEDVVYTESITLARSEWSLDRWNIA